MGSSLGAGWRLTVYPTAGEAGGSFTYAGTRPRGSGPGESDPDRSRAEAARRARTKLRRYCAANQLARLGTLTYRGQGCHDVRVVRRDVATFVRTVRRRLHGESFPYAWVPEWHKSDHGLHLHVALPQAFTDPLVRTSWPHGFIDLGEGAVGGDPVAQARRAAGYLSKYVAKSFDDRPESGLHRYEVGQGFQPPVVAVHGTTREEALGRASEIMGGPPTFVWDSSEEEDWKAPPSVWAQWGP